MASRNRKSCHVLRLCSHRLTASDCRRHLVTGVLSQGYGTKYGTKLGTAELSDIRDGNGGDAFQQMPIARCACWLLSLLEPQDDAGLYRRRSRRPAGSGLFDDIPSQDNRERAEKIYSRLCARHSERLATCPWLRPIVAGRARWLATHPEAHGSGR